MNNFFIYKIYSLKHFTFYPKLSGIWKCAPQGFLRGRGIIYFLLC